MRTRKIMCVIGHFGFGENLLNGQTVKTKILTAALDGIFGQENVLKVDTHGGAKALVKLLFRIPGILESSDNVVILPAHNGLRIIVPLVSFWNVFFKRKLHYAVIGGWLPEFLKERQGLAKKLKRFTGIYVETTTMKKALDAMGFDNVVVMPNCKELQQLTPEELVYPKAEPYKLCTFSRVMKEKGIEDAIEAVKAINEKLGRTVYALDIYGPVDAGQTQWFADLQNTFPEFVRYGGLVPFDQSVEVLKDYFVLLFPTRFYTEGVPGTIIDAYAAGVPVISAKWESFADVVEEGITGFGYEFENVKALEALLLQIAENPKMIAQRKENCLQKARTYLPEAVMKIIVDKMEASAYVDGKK